MMLSPLHKKATLASVIVVFVGVVGIYLSTQHSSILKGAITQEGYIIADNDDGEDTIIVEPMNYYEALGYGGSIRYISTNALHQLPNQPVYSAHLGPLSYNTTYGIYATWPAHSSFSRSVKYVMSSSSGDEASAIIDQQQPAEDFLYNGVYWQKIGVLQTGEGSGADDEISVQILDDSGVLTEDTYTVIDAFLAKPE